MLVLNVPTAGMEELVLRIGGCSGASVDKVEAFAIDLCSPGDLDDDNNNIDNAATDASPPKAAKKQKLSRQEMARQEIRRAYADSIAVRRCVAHVLCRVDAVNQDDGHYLLRCTQLAAWVQRDYWNGRHFLPQAPQTKPYMTFLGTKTFGYVHASSGDGRTTET